MALLTGRNTCKSCNFQFTSSIFISNAILINNSAFSFCPDRAIDDSNGMLLQVAQEGLSGCGVIGPGEGSGGRVRTSGLGSYPEIHVPVYAAVKGVSTEIRCISSTVHPYILQRIYILLSNIAITVSVQG